MNPSDAGPWFGDWAWGLPLIVLTVVIHVCGLALIGESVVHRMSGSLEHRRFMPRFALVMGRTSFAGHFPAWHRGGDLGRSHFVPWGLCRIRGPRCCFR